MQCRMSGGGGITTVFSSISESCVTRRSRCGAAKNDDRGRYRGGAFQTPVHAFPRAECHDLAPHSSEKIGEGTSVSQSQIVATQGTPGRMFCRYVGKYVIIGLWL